MRRTLLLQSLKALVCRIWAAAGDRPLVEAVTPRMVAITPLPRAWEVAGWLDDRDYYTAPDRQNGRLLVTID